MRFVLVAGGVWLVAGAVVGVLVGRSIDVPDDCEIDDVLDLTDDGFEVDAARMWSQVEEALSS